MNDTLAHIPFTYFDNTFLKFIMIILIPVFKKGILQIFSHIVNDYKVCSHELWHGQILFYVQFIIHCYNILCTKYEKLFLTSKKKRKTNWKMLNNTLTHATECFNIHILTLSLSLFVDIFATLFPFQLDDCCCHFFEISPNKGWNEVDSLR